MRSLAILLLLLHSRDALAQVPGASPRARGVTVSGVIVDSLSRAPLPGALVQLAPADTGNHFGTTVSADALGRYTLADVPDGTYLLGFYHPLLDSLFLEPTVHLIVVAGQPVIQDLAVPSPARLRAAICGDSAAAGSAVMAGVVRDARDLAALRDVRVAAEWLELSIARGSVGRRIVRLAATTGDNGWFALCGVPAGGSVSLIASRGADSTDRLGVLVPTAGYARGDLFLGTRGQGTATSPMRGIVVTADGRPVAAAQVAIERSHTLSNARGEWVLDDAPPGTRMLEVRALGYYPERRRVDVITGAPPVRIALSTFKAVLDTIRVTASRISGVDLEGFRNRKATSGFGHFITPDDIARRNPTVTSDLLRMVPTLRIEASKGSAQQTITMRGLWVQWPGGIPRCSPLLYIDGQYRGVLDENQTADDIDHWVAPRDIAGIEVYTQQEVPPQFSRGMAAECGSILIWTKLRD